MDDDDKMADWIEQQLPSIHKQSLAMSLTLLLHLLNHTGVSNLCRPWSRGGGGGGGSFVGVKQWEARKVIMCQSCSDNAIVPSLILWVACTPEQIVVIISYKMWCVHLVCSCVHTHRRTHTYTLTQRLTCRSISRELVAGYRGDTWHRDKRIVFTETYLGNDSCLSLRLFPPCSLSIHLHFWM